MPVSSAMRRIHLSLLIAMLVLSGLLGMARFYAKSAARSS
jgi:hypothetical protein